MQFQVVEQIGAEAARKQDYPAFKVRGTRLAPENPGFSQKVTGTVVNTGKKAAKVGAVTVALYEGARLVYATNLGFLYPYSTTQIVAPGKSAPFKASILGYTKKRGKIVTYVRASTKDGLLPALTPCRLTGLILRARGWGTSFAGGRGR